MATTPSGNSGYLGSTYPAPTDPNYYTQQTGLNSIIPQAYSSNNLESMFAPQSMQFTPANSMATNPFLQLFLNAQQKNLGTQRPQIGGPNVAVEG
ncbi:MAG: hypothetical protein KGL39_14520 [Patescibacteria group bacterium]|nr:hypothetical protein [Patescibacteria group bacterium]